MGFNPAPARLLGGALAAFLAAGSLLAQGGPATLQFSFSNPGARSLGMGGAFAALADDATAAFANPAGLVQLTRPEVSLEGRYWSYSTPYTEGGRVSGEATGIGLDGPLRRVESEFDTTALSFLSLVYPGRNWTVALSRHQLGKFHLETANLGLFTDVRMDDPQPACLAATNVCRYPDFVRYVDVDVVTTSAALAYRPTDAFSLGLGISLFETEIGALGSQYEISESTLPEGFFGPNSYAEAGRVGNEILESDDTDWGINAGFLWFINPNWSLGGYYREGPDAEMRGERISGPALDPPIPVGSVGDSDNSIPLSIPDVYGLGVAHRSVDGSWTVGLEWAHVEYSSIIESIGSTDFINTEFVTLDDVNELRLGLEYLFLETTPLLAIRAGLWIDPDHQIRSFEDDPLERALLPPGDDEIHYSLGVGVALRRFQADLAADFSDPVTTASLSLIYAF